MKKSLLLGAALVAAAFTAQADYYMIGSNVNGKSWQLKVADAVFKATDTAGVYEWTGTELGTGFKINDGTWSSVNFGGNGSTKLTLGTPFPYVNGGDSKNIMFDNLSVLENPKVVLDIKAGTITVSGQEAVREVEYYVIGANVNGQAWALKAADAKFTKIDENNYEWKGTELGSGFKINDGTWGAVNIGAYWDNETEGWYPINLNTPFTYNNDGNSGDIKFVGFDTLTSPVIKLDLKAGTITVDGEKPGTEPTGVATIESEGSAVYYNLQGARVAQPERGLYIRVINGKAQKVVK